MAPGTRRLDIGVAADLVGARGFVDLSAHISDHVAAFARAELGLEFATMDPVAAAIAGISVRW